MNDLKIKRDKNSGHLIVEKDFSSPGRLAIRVDLIFKPSGVWRQILCWLGLDFPGPVLVKIENGGKSLHLDLDRIRKRLSVTDCGIFIAQEGRGTFTAMLNPEDFQGRWKAKVKVTALYN